MTDKITNSNSNNTTNNEFETIFWKVIHNKYLFYIIFQKIEEIRHSGEFIYRKIIQSKKQTNNQQQIQQYVMKFKEIYSLSLISRNGLWVLLSDKLLSDQYIEIEKGGISVFLEHCKDFEIIELMYYKYKLQFESVDLIKHSIIAGNMIALDYFLSNLQEYQIHPSTIEMVLKTGNDSLVESILNVDIVDPACVLLNDGVDNYLQYVFGNMKIQDKSKAIQYIMDHPNLSSTFTVTSTKIKKKKLKQTHQTGCGVKYKVNEIKFTEFLSIKDTTVMKKLLDLSLVKRTTFNEYIKQISITGVDSETLLLYINILYRLCLDEENDYDYDFIPYEESLKIDEILKLVDEEKEKEKQFKQMIVLKTKSTKFYNQFLIDHDEIIQDQLFLNNNDTMDNVVLNHTFSMFSLNGLKYLIEKKIKTTINITSGSGDDKTMDYITSNQSRLIEFYKLYYSQSNLQVRITTPKDEKETKFVGNSSDGNGILKSNIWIKLKPSTLNSILSTKTSNGVVQGVSKNHFLIIDKKVRRGKCVVDFSIIRWYVDVILKSLITGSSKEKIVEFTQFLYVHFKETSEIDYFFQNFNQFNHFEFENISCDSLELVNYLNGKFQKMVPRSIIYKNYFIKSLINCDTASLKQITKFENTMFTHSSLDDLNHIKTPQQVLILFIGLFSTNGFNCFSPVLKYEFSYTFYRILFGIPFKEFKSIIDIKCNSGSGTSGSSSNNEMVIILILSFIISEEWEYIDSFKRLLNSNCINEIKQIELDQDILDWILEIKYTSQRVKSIQLDSVYIYDLIILLSPLYKQSNSTYSTVFNKLFKNFLSSTPHLISVGMISNANKLCNQFDVESSKSNTQDLITCYSLGCKSMKLLNYITFFGNLLSFSGISKVIPVESIEKESVDQLFSKLLVNFKKQNHNFRISFTIQDTEYIEKLLEFYLVSNDFDMFFKRIEMEKITTITTRMLSMYLTEIYNNDQLYRLIQSKLIGINVILSTCVGLGKFEFVQFILNNFEIKINTFYNFISLPPCLILQYIFENHFNVLPQISKDLFNSFITMAFKTSNFDNICLIVKTFPQFPIDIPLSNYISSSFIQPGDYHFITHLIQYFISNLPLDNCTNISNIKNLLSKIKRL